MRKGSSVGNALTIYRGLSGPPGPKPRKSLKKVSRGLRPRDPPRVWKKPRKSLESLEKVSKRTLETFSRLSRGPGAGGPGRLFSDFFGVSRVATRALTGAPRPGGPESPKNQKVADVWKKDVFRLAPLQSEIAPTTF